MFSDNTDMCNYNPYIFQLALLSSLHTSEKRVIQTRHFRWESDKATPIMLKIINKV